MRNKCLLGLGLVFVISLTSMVAFAFSFTGTPADEVDETEMIVRAVVYFRVYKLTIDGDNLEGDWICTAQLLEVK